MGFFIGGGQEGSARWLLSVSLIAVAFGAVGYSCSKLQKTIPPQPPTPVEELLEPKPSARSR